MIGIVLLVFIAIVIAIVIAIANVSGPSDEELKEIEKIKEIEKYCKYYIEYDVYNDCVLNDSFKPYKDIKDDVISMESRCKLGYYDSYTEEEKQFVLKHYKELQQKIKEMDAKYTLLKDVYDTMRTRKIKEQKIKTLCFPKSPRR